jgi:hypothetical protein
VGTENVRLGVGVTVSVADGSLLTGTIVAVGLVMGSTGMPEGVAVGAPPPEVSGVEVGARVGVEVGVALGETDGCLVGRSVGLRPGGVGVLTMGRGVDVAGL